MSVAQLFRTSWNYDNQYDTSKAKLEGIKLSNEEIAFYMGVGKYIFRSSDGITFLILGKTYRSKDIWKVNHLREETTSS